MRPGPAFSAGPYYVKIKTVELKRLNNLKIMLSKLPIDLSKVRKENIDREILRIGVIAELDAISLYEQLAAMAESEAIKKVLMDVAREEKEHVGEFQTLLFDIDPEQVEEFEEGKKEVREMLSE